MGYMYGNHGISQVPSGNPKDVYPLIKYSLSDPDSYATHVEQLRDALSDYAGLTSDTYESCTDGTANEQPCPLDLNRLGDCWSGSDANFTFGYPEGKPCVLLKINKIYNWHPLTYKENHWEHWIEDRYENGSLPVYCESFKARKSSDGAAIGELIYYPEVGFPTSCFPYCGRNTTVKYHAPIMMVKFNHVIKDKTAAVWCRIFARNIDPSRKTGVGSASFRILVTD